MATLNVVGNIKTQTAALWAADVTVYTNQQILVTSDVQYTGTDQNKFKIADGVGAWSTLDYMPIDHTGGDVTGGDVLTIGAKKVTAAMMEDGTDGELFTWDSSGVLAKVPVGTATQVLTSNGAGAAPTFQAGGGADNFLAQYFNTTGSGLSDSTTYHLGQMTGLQTGANAFARITLPAGTITEAYISIYNASTFGTSENITINLISNDGGTSDTITTVAQADVRNFSLVVTGLSITIVNGNTYIDIVTPVFVTNPANSQIRVGVKIEPS